MPWGIMHSICFAIFSSAGCPLSKLISIHLNSTSVSEISSFIILSYTLLLLKSQACLWQCHVLCVACTILA
ncbi:uncharacterized protein LAESUDRAFT_723955 [Laetiporus sulphureus 93-53]|uniref:Uncharacterized protein n=1 Tax=Laetiporus sulphureus 93-53 TaxID=1314785 RepID=A0A165F5N1_9APHY|nr:uncharacterized protein LAESUDRAFT_723955 [Laetiporus sulphureus 93-53]KZT08436.1 hypothetical protein LAESUDRAFT_723955 [Laetiporus sulphureus 93-53]